MKRAAAIVVAALLALTGCSGGSPAPSAGPSETPAPPTTPEPPPPPATWPLTGVLQDAPAGKPILNPVVGVKIENIAAARPWVGLAAADLVFVEMVEAGLTRFHAIYNSQFPAVVGPVRSLRPMDAAILGQWNATLVASGGQQYFIDRARSVVQKLIMEGEKGYFRQRGRRMPHNLMYRLGEQRAQFAAPTSIPPFTQFSEASSAASGQAATALTVKYPAAASKWTWNPGGKVWLRDDNGRKSVEVDGTQVAAKNVLVLAVNSQNTGARDPAGNPVPETILNGSGKLTLFVDGKSVEGTWQKGGDKDPFILKDASGNPLLLAPGKTWVELLPQMGSLDVVRPAAG